MTGVQTCALPISGTQACRVLRSEGIRVILVNSNPATIMTDPSVADVIYLEPLTVEVVEAVIAREQPGAPHETLLVLDAITGQNGLQQARVFKESMDLTGIVLTKLDGTAKGGVVVAIQEELRIPVQYVGVGEQVEDLQHFDPDTFVQALFESKQ